MCDDWFHFDCVDYIGTVEDAEEINFICPRCELKMDEKERK